MASLSKDALEQNCAVQNREQKGIRWGRDPRYRRLLHSARPAMAGKKESLAAAPGALAARAGVVMNGNAYVMNGKAKRCQKSST